jgi:hypothetical protein
MNEFKVGSKVWYVSGHYGSGDSNPLHTDFPDITGEIIRINLTDGCPLGVCWSNGKTNDYREVDLELITNKNIMSNIVEFFKNISASKEDKLLKEMGIEDPINVPTAEGLKLSAMINYKKNRDEIVEICKQKKTEEEEKK